MIAICLTDVGRSRDKNEDSCIYRKFNNGWDLLMVADGMGGHNAGEIASSIAVRSITEYLEEKIKDGIDISNMEDVLTSAIAKANDDIYTEAQNNVSCSGMGTTVTMAVISRDEVLIGHIGDSRAYILSNNKLKKITSDHSLVAELVKNGTITEDEAQHHPQRNIITRALGAKDNVKVDIEKIGIMPSDIILLCSDGLTNMLDDGKIEEILIKNQDIENGAHELIDLANSLGGYDNITVAVAKVTCPDGEVRQ